MMIQSGIVLLDKPLGVTSAGAVRVVETRLGLRCGHLGTLDPMATGLLVVLLGHAVKLMPYYLHGTKRYLATVRFGQATETYDSEGSVVATAPVPSNLAHSLPQVLASLLGEQMQVPPVYSAIKKGGKRLYDLARQGKEVQPEARKVTFLALDLLKLDGCDALIDVRCSSGTYIRSLAYDLGLACGSVAHLAGLRRLESSPFTLDGAVSLEQASDRSFNLEAAARPVESFEPPGRKYIMTDPDAMRVLRGMPLPHPAVGSSKAGESWSLFTESGVLIAVAETSESGAELAVKRVIRQDVELPNA